ncbi:MAG: XRE family transcriptional regulator [Methylococcales bacterium]|jgi:predicted XRE-type DNA-binding protein|nr:XRE family transcriptional regulator [Methylococcales bacterium]
MNDVVKSGENLFVALGFPPHEAEILQMRADLMNRLALWIQEKGLTQTEAAEKLGVTQARISDLVRGHWKKFSLDMLLMLAARAELKFRIELDWAA